MSELSESSEFSENKCACGLCPTCHSNGRIRRYIGKAERDAHNRFEMGKLKNFRTIFTIKQKITNKIKTCAKLFKTKVKETEKQKQIEQHCISIQKLLIEHWIACLDLLYHLRSPTDVNETEVDSVKREYKVFIDSLDLTVLKIGNEVLKDFLQKDFLRKDLDEYRCINDEDSEDE